MTAQPPPTETSPAPRGRRPVDGGRRRSFLPPVVALVAAVVLGLSGASTYAFWQDTVRVTTGETSAGTLDLQVDNAAVGPGTPYTKTAISATNLYPGERVAFPLAIRNVGGATVRYSATVTRAASPVWTYDSTALTVQVVAGTTTAAGTGYPRTGSCTGTALNATPVAVAAAGNPQALFTDHGPLAGNTTENLCLLVAMPSTAATANQGKTGALVIDLVAQQVAP